MRVKFNTNLGSTDAEKLELDFKLCLQGSEIKCGDKAGSWLVARGIATDISPPAKAKPELQVKAESIPETKPATEPIPEPVELKAIPDDEAALEAALEAATAPTPPAPKKSKS